MKKGLMKKIFSATCAVVLSVGCLAGFGACKEEVPEEEVTVYMPDGAPAMALARLMAEDTEEDGVTYRVVKSDLIASKVTNNDEGKNADLCVMPLTAAAKLLGDGSRYVMLGAVTHGNVYIISEDETPLQDLSVLANKKIGVLQINNVPGLVFKTVLNKNNVNWYTAEEGVDAPQNAVALEGILGAEAVMKDSEYDYYVLAEPAVNVQVQKKGFHIVGDLQALYGGKNGYPQAVLVAKRDFVEENGEWTENFMGEISTAADWLKTATGEQIVSAVTAHLEDSNTATTLQAPLLTAEVVARCGVRFVSAEQCKTSVRTLIEEFIQIQPAASAVPEEDFYWTK